ncbi:MAG: hypothetical protein Q4G55_07400, partial [bacterium]|nr:hypothetical protein [bacterium]
VLCGKRNKKGITQLRFLGLRFTGRTAKCKWPLVVLYVFIRLNLLLFCNHMVCGVCRDYYAQKSHSW